MICADHCLYGLPGRRCGHGSPQLALDRRGKAVSVWPQLPDDLPESYQCRNFQPRAERVDLDQPVELVAPNIPRIDLEEPTGSDFAEVAQPAPLLPLKSKCMGVTENGDACPEAALSGSEFCATCYEKVNNVPHPTILDEEPEPEPVKKANSGYTPDPVRSARMKKFKGTNADGSKCAAQCQHIVKSTGMRCTRKVMRGYPYCAQHMKEPEYRERMEVISRRFSLPLPINWIASTPTYPASSTEQVSDDADKEGDRVVPLRRDGFPQAPQCQHTIKSSGNQCRHRVMRGYPYCPTHMKLPRYREQMEEISRRTGRDLPIGFYQDGHLWRKKKRTA